MTEGAHRCCFSTKVTERVAECSWRTRLSWLAILVGSACGLVCSIYTLVFEFLIEHVWYAARVETAPQTPPSLPRSVSILCCMLARCVPKINDDLLHVLRRETGPELFVSYLGNILPTWCYIPLACIALGSLNGLLIKCLGEPSANLPGVVKEIYDHGKIDWADSPRMAVVSLTSIVAAGSLGPEAPLVAIGGGLASFVCRYVRLSEAETLFITMCGMGAGLAAFFGEPVGGAIFACEVIHRYGAEYYEAFIPTVLAGISCNFVFRLCLDLPQKAIWQFDAADTETPNTLTTLWGIPLGIVGGLLGRFWIQFTIAARGSCIVHYGLGKRPVLRGCLGGILIGGVGMLLPETLFWAEHESQTIIDGGATPLPHVWPAKGALGTYDLTSPSMLFVIGIAKLFVISVTVLANYRGGFIFPFMFSGVCIGCGFAQLAVQFLGRAGQAALGLNFAAAALGCAAAINTSVTRTVLSTPLVLVSLSGRPDDFPCLLIASVVSLYMTGEVSIITAARKRLRREQLGAENLTDCWTDQADNVVDKWKAAGTKTFSKRLERLSRDMPWAVNSDQVKQASSLRTDLEELTAEQANGRAGDRGGSLKKEDLDPIIAKVKTQIEAQSEAPMTLL